MFRKNKLAMLVGEFLGTGLLTIVVLAALRSQAGGFFVPVAAGLLVIVMALALLGISGALFNPALTIALWTVRKLRAAQALMYIVVQVAGAAAAWYLYKYLTNFDASMLQHGNLTELAPRAIIAEALGAFVFAMALAAAVYQRFNTGLKAATIGLGLILGGLIASLAAAGFVNPAVSFGLQQWNIWTNMLAPVLGAVLGMNVYNLLFVETELAESKDTSRSSGDARLDSSVSPSVVAAVYDAKKDLAEDKVKVSGAGARASTAKKVASNVKTTKTATKKTGKATKTAKKR